MPPSLPPPPAEAPAPPTPLLIVGIGASAGGLAALQQFFAHLPPPAADLAFVVVMHLSPDHESHLAGILQAHTPLLVTQVTGPLRVAPQQVYVIPPGQDLAMDDGMLRLQPPALDRARRTPIDLLFRTLAAAHGEQAVAVVLSGTGSDGALGLPRVKELGGFTLVQDPAEAEYDGMPRSAIATGFADAVLPVAAMGARLQQYQANRRQIALAPQPAAPAPPGTADPLADILALLYTRTGRNFTAYKRATLTRRVERRLQICDQPDLAAYLTLLRAAPAEVQALLRDLLISVTNFFRDPPVWDGLAATVLPALVADAAAAGRPVRAWVAGCATGEEAYSLAILLHEQAARQAVPPPIQVFASDLDAAAIAVARAGRYPATIALDVTPDRLLRFFHAEGPHYQIGAAVRETVLFAVHDVLKDPPFSHVDLISCRNLLIYLNRTAQDQVLRLFHFALQPDGHLLLGTAESADSVPHLFTPADKAAHRYRRRAAPPALHPLRFDLLGTGERRPATPVAALPARPPEPPVALADLHY